MKGAGGSRICFIDMRGIGERVCSSIILLGIVVCLLAKRNDQCDRIANARA